MLRQMIKEAMQLGIAMLRLRRKPTIRAPRGGKLPPHLRSKQDILDWCARNPDQLKVVRSRDEMTEPNTVYFVVRGSER